MRQASLSSEREREWPLSRLSSERQRLASGVSPLGPLGFDFAQHRQTLRPSSSRDPQQSPASFRTAVKDLEDPAVQCRWLAVSG